MLPHYTLTPATEQELRRFWAKVAKSDGCWLWQAHTIHNGYGRFKAGGHMVLAHRFSWIVANGPIADDLLVCHKCDIHYPVGDITYRRCVNPAHLFLGTKLDNARDMVAKGRQACGDANGARLHPETVPRGERGGLAKLTTEQVIAIHRLHAQGGITQQAIADQFGVGDNTVSRILSGKRWGHIKPLWDDEDEES